MAIQQSPYAGLRELALFAGGGGGILGGQLLGWQTICAVERDAYAAAVLAQRQNDGCLQPFPIWSDVCSFDGRAWRGLVDVVSGGFPCQDISAAGRGAGIDGARSGLWGEMARIIGEVRPRFAFVENSPMLIHRGLTRVIGDLAEMGYDAQWCVVSASDVGAPHRRDRIWILATDTQQCEFLAHTNHGRIGRWEQQSPSVKKTTHTKSDQIGRRTRGDQAVASSQAIRSQSVVLTRSIRQRQPSCLPHAYGMWKQQPKRLEQNKWRRFGNFCTQISYAKSAGFTPRIARQKQVQSRRSGGGRVQWWATEPNVGRVAHGVAARMDRLKAIGNGQVSRVAAAAFTILMEDSK